MRTATMCFSILQGPRCRIHTLVNFWSGNFHNRTRTYSTSSNLHGSIINGLEGGRSKKWTRRTVTTKTEERNKAIRSSKTSSIRHEILDGTVATSATLNINETEISQFQKIQYSDIKKTITENKNLSSLVTTLVFDFETTGFSREKDRIIEFALQDLKGGENSTFQTLVNPECYVPNQQIHGITTNMVNRSEVPRMKDLLPILLQYINSRVKPGGYVLWVAHNARNFDVPFLFNEFARCSIDIPSNWLFLDTLPLARELMKSEGSKLSKTSLQALREHYGIPLIGSAHRAMSDVMSLSLIFQLLTYDLKLTPHSLLLDRSFTASDIANQKKKSSR
ncbi:hypothetical protein FNV43_RR05020 [Rhamnella rubrinervis]|uniref:Exonuclease domain-containing protein n=1 Tax=Rhamnella rubrinervis TaxID=2594499 RepID=A0A8K0HKU9_9ROSA|nr:hypothetical protein FNV43_RR05020 [Rhamnella rubrinervis]